MNERAERIVAAAVKHNGKIYTGKRHAEIMREIWDEVGNVKIPQDEQGFVADNGQFLNRFQSGAVAFAAGQTKHRYETLLSEHVW